MQKNKAFDFTYLFCHSFLFAVWGSHTHVILVAAVVWHVTEAGLWLYSSNVD